MWITLKIVELSTSQNGHNLDTFMSFIHWKYWEIKGALFLKKYKYRLYFYMDLNILY